MMKKYPLILLIVSFAYSQNYDKMAKEGINSITSTDIKKHITYLASPELKGRETSYQGQKLAAKYLADQFKKFGLKPAGDNGTYFQNYEVDLTRLNPKSCIVIKYENDQKEFSLINDYLTVDHRDTTITGGIVFCGYTDTKLNAETKKNLKGKFQFAFVGKRFLLPDTSTNKVMQQLFANREFGTLGMILITDESIYGEISKQWYSFGGILERGMMNLQGKPSIMRFINIPTYIIS